jgi:hypothetical protein
MSTEKEAKKEVKTYDFEEAVNSAGTRNFKSYINRKEHDLKNSITGSYPKNQVWVVVFILLISFVALSVFSFVQIQEKNELLASYENRQVAGVQEGGVNNIVSAGSFSIVLDLETPKEFDFKIEQTNFEFLENREGQKASLIAEVSDGNKSLTSGMVIWSTQYDRELKPEEFAEIVAKKLGESYNAHSNKIAIKNNREVIKIESNKPTDPIYYTSITDDNYYVIKVVNETTKDTEFVEISRFTDLLLNNTWLN